MLSAAQQHGPLLYKTTLAVIFKTAMAVTCTQQHWPSLHTTTLAIIFKIAMAVTCTATLAVTCTQHNTGRHLHTRLAVACVHIKLISILYKDYRNIIGYSLVLNLHCKKSHFKK
jgi:hypothetical protein